MEFLPLSASPVYDYMREFYEKGGIDVWTAGVVPSFVTTNACVAKKVCGFVAAFLRDSGSKECKVVELGAGSAMLGFLVAKELLRRADTRKLVKDGKITVVLTDLSELVVESWTREPALAALHAKGVIEFARLDAESVDSLTAFVDRYLGHSPVVVLANYVADTLRSDAFTIMNGLTLEQRVRASMGPPTERRARSLEEASCSEEEDDTEASVRRTWDDAMKGESGKAEWAVAGSHLEHCSIDWETREIENSRQYYSTRTEGFVPTKGEARVLDAVLGWYSKYNASSEVSVTFTIPVGFLRALYFLCSNRMSMCLVGDKGLADPDLFQAQSPPHLARHGSFSIDVNFHAMSLFIRSLNGAAIHETDEDSDIRLAVLLCTPSSDTPQKIEEEEEDESDSEAAELDFVRWDGPRVLGGLRFDQVEATFQDYISLTLDSFRILTDAPSQISKLSYALSKCRLANWDIDVVASERKVFERYLPDAPSFTKEAVIRGVKRTWTCRLYTCATRDISFEVGKILIAAGDPEGAYDAFVASWNEHGSHEATARALLSLTSKDDLNYDEWSRAVSPTENQEEEQDDKIEMTLGTSKLIL